MDKEICGNRRITKAGQIVYLKKQGLKIDDNEDFELFLLEAPYQTTINQVKYYYKKNGEYLYNTSSELISRYKRLKELDMIILERIIKIESGIKNHIVSHVAKEKLYLEDNFINTLISKNLKTWSYIKTSSNQNQDVLDNQRKFLNEKFYKFINACSSEVLRAKLLVIPDLACSLKKVEDYYEDEYKNSEKREKFKRNYYISSKRGNDILVYNLNLEEKIFVAGKIENLNLFINNIQNETLIYICEKAVSETYLGKIFNEEKYYRCLFKSQRNVNLFVKTYSEKLSKVFKKFKNGESGNKIKKSEEFKLLKEETREYYIKLIFDDILEYFCKTGEHKKYFNKDLLNDKKLKSNLLYEIFLLQNKNKMPEKENEFVLNELNNIFDFRNKIAHGYTFVQCFKEGFDVEIKRELLRQILGDEIYKEASLFIGFHKRARHLEK